MKLLSAPRQPFVGLALMAATGVIVGEVIVVRSAVLTLAAIVLAICILVALCWPKLPATYLIVAVGFFLLHKFATTNTAGQQLAHKLGERPRVVTAVGCVITEPKIAPSGFATFLLTLKSIELEGKNESTRAVWQVRWKGAPEFGDELKLFGTAEPIAPPRNPGEFDMRAYLARHDIRRMLFVRYAEDGTLIRHRSGNPVLRAAQASRTWMQNALCSGLDDAPEEKVSSVESCLASGTKRRRTLRSRFSKPARFTFSPSLACMWELWRRFCGCWRRSRACHASAQRHSSFHRSFSMRR